MFCELNVAVNPEYPFPWRHEASLQGAGTAEATERILAGFDGAALQRVRWVRQHWERPQTHQDPPCSSVWKGLAVAHNMCPGTKAQSCQSQGRKQKNVHRAAGGAGGAAHVARLRALGASTTPVGQEAVGQLQREAPPKQQTLINFYFCFFRRDLLFISAQMYLIISSKGKSSSRWGHSWGNFSAEYFMEYKCNFQPFALDRK